MCGCLGVVQKQKEIKNEKLAKGEDPDKPFM